MLKTDVSSETMPQTLSSFSSPVSSELSTFTTSLSNFSKSSGLVPTSNDLARLNFFIRIAYLLIGVVGVIGNLQVTVVMLTYAPLRQRLANYYLINQCVLDLIMSIFVILLYSDISSSFVNGVIEELRCRLWFNRSLYLSLFTSSVFSITALAVERYAEIVFPIQHKLLLTRRMVALSLVVVNLAGISFKLSIAVPITGIINGVCVFGFISNPFIKKLIGLLNFLLEFFVPLAVIGFCYVGMARSLNRKVQPTASKTFSQARKNIIKTLLFIVLVFVICTTLKQIVSLLFWIDVRSSFTSDDTLWNISTMVSYSSCCFNPLVYFLKYKEFQKGIRWLYCRHHCIKSMTGNHPQRQNIEEEINRTSERY